VENLSMLTTHKSRGSVLDEMDLGVRTA